MHQLTRTPLYRALHRPNLLLGAERELVLLSGLIAAALVLSALNVIAALVGIGVWLTSLHLLRMMAAADPEMSRIYRRQLQYRRYYAPRARFSRDL